MPLDPVSLGLGGLGILTNFLGGSSLAKKQKQAAAEQERTSNLGIDLQEEMYADQMEQFQPYLEFGQESIPGLNQSLTGSYDYQGQPEYGYRQQAGQNALQGALGDRMGSYAQDEFTRGLNLDENAQGMGRLYDRAMIGQGATGSAGQSALGYGNALSRAYQTQAANTQAGRLGASNTMMDTYGRAGEQLSSIPSYIQQNNYLRSLNQMGN